MRNAFIVIKDLIDLIPETECKKYQKLKYNLNKRILQSWTHAAPEKKYSMWFWNIADELLNSTSISCDEVNEKEWLKTFVNIYHDPEYKIDQSDYKYFIKEKTIEL